MKHKNIQELPTKEIATVFYGQYASDKTERDELGISTYGNRLS
jgi:hypothetical protein